MTPLILTIGLLGLAVGSFLNVVVCRVPAGRSIVRPGSACPECSHEIRARHNVPVLSWLWLRGRCADCAAPISIRYPLVELATGLLFVGVAAQLITSGRLALAPALLYFAALGLALALIDLDVRRLPDRLVLPSYGVLAALIGAGAWALGEPAVLLRAAVGGAALFTGYLALALAWPNGMGFGDVKFAGIVGAVLGAISYRVLLVGAAAAFLLGAVVGLAVIAARRSERPATLPFGPFMVAGSLFALFLGAPLADTYGRLVLGS